MKQFNRSDVPNRQDHDKTVEKRSFSPVVSLKEVHKSFNLGSEIETEALRGLSFDLHPAEKLALLGPSGCGKSTALRLIAGLDSLSSGSITVDRSGRANTGFVFQDPTLLPWATVFDNIAKPLSLAGVARDEISSRVKTMIEKVDLTDFAGSYPRELSGGMKMRVSIARALVTRPSLLLMDEPFAALDEITRFRLNDLLLEQQALDGFSLLFVTHSVFESVYLSDRVLVMTPRPGRVAATLDTRPDRPRNADYRLSSLFIDNCKRVSQALDGAMKSA